MEIDIDKRRLIIQGQKVSGISNENVLIEKALQLYLATESKKYFPGLCAK